MIGTDVKRASAVFRFLKNNHAQREVLTSLSEVYLAEQDVLREKLRDLLRRYTILAEQRNQLFHRPFGYDTTDESRPIGLPPEKWSSLRYGFGPCGGQTDVEEKAQA